jgi:hypothetical protein
LIFSTTSDSSSIGGSIVVLKWALPGSWPKPLPGTTQMPVLSRRASQYLVTVLEKELTSARAQLFDALRELDQARADLAAAAPSEPESDADEYALERAEAQEARL